MTSRLRWHPLLLKGLDQLWRVCVRPDLFLIWRRIWGLRYGNTIDDKGFLGMSPVSPVLGNTASLCDLEKMKLGILLTRELLRAIDRFCEQNGILSCNFYVRPSLRGSAVAAACGFLAE